MMDEGWLAALVDQASIGILSTDLAGEVRTWNAGCEGLFGYTASEAVGRNVDELIVPKARDYERREALRRVAHGETYLAPETFRLHQDGHPVMVSMSIFPIVDESGNVLGLGNMLRDIAVEQQVDQIWSARKTADLCDSVVRTLESVAAEVAAIGEISETNGAVSGRLGLVEARLGELIDELRAKDPFLHGDECAGPPVLDRDLARLVEEVVPAHIQAVVNVPQGASDKVLDDAAAGGLLYVAREALLNAVRHSAASRIAIDFRRGQFADILVVQDDGGGFNPETTRYRLGIPTMRNRMERIGGRLEITSIPGMGTTIRASIRR